MRWQLNIDAHPVSVNPHLPNQLRGRSGRQGDPGESKFFLSFEDDLLRLFANSPAIRLINNEKNKDLQLEFKAISQTIESAQRRIENMNFTRRKNVLTYDDVMNQQRNMIYQERSQVLDDADLRNTLTDMIRDSVGATFDLHVSEHERNFSELRAHYLGLLTTPDSYSYTDEEAAALSAPQLHDLREQLIQHALDIYRGKDEIFGADNMREVERAVLLRTVDEKWMDHIDAMDDLKDSIGLSAYSQRNPVTEYRIIGSQMFEQMIADIRDTTARRLLSVMPREKIERVQTAQPITAPRDHATVRNVVRRGANNLPIGRNSPCPCGSGKRYKRCCGAPDRQNGKD